MINYKRGTNSSIMINILVICLALISSCRGWCEVEAKSTLSQEEIRDINSQLKILNKPPIQSLEKPDGTIIDCIDIRKQPAFDHPLLKNHTLQIRPSLVLEKLATSTVHDNQKTIHEAKSKVLSKCPSRTVPIRRTTKRDLLAAKSALRHYKNFAPASTSNAVEGDIYFAGASTPEGSWHQYLGAKVNNSVYDLKMIVATQTSAASLRIGNGVEGTFTSIEYGWTLNNDLYGDTKVRTYSLWTADGFERTGCFNTLCPGFVQVSQVGTIGQEITNFSQYNKNKYYISYQILKDPKTQNWWLYQTIPDAGWTSIGYWPKELFPNMTDYSSNVQAGGKVFVPSLEPKQPDMGSGHYKEGDVLKTANVIIDVIDNSYGVIPHPELVALFNAPNLYKSQIVDEHNVLYGGPGFS